MYVAKTPHHTQIVEKNMYNTGLPAERAILCKDVARLHGEGMSIATACAKVGLGMRSWYRYVEEYQRVEMWYQQALKRRADAVAQSVFELATGKAGKRRDEYDAEGELRGSTVETLPPDTAAAKYYLNNVAPKEWADKGEPSTGSQVIINMPAVTVGGKPMQFDCGVVDAEVSDV